ncbi:hypothetical protein EC968_003222 [Mortierella alpina]|nr:hypothetical protein EC968_003222 [Mortierella alpina]
MEPLDGEGGSFPAPGEGGGDEEPLGGGGEKTLEGAGGVPAGGGGGSEEEGRAPGGGGGEAAGGGSPAKVTGGASGRGACSGQEASGGVGAGGGGEGACCGACCGEEEARAAPGGGQYKTISTCAGVFDGTVRAQGRRWREQHREQELARNRRWQEEHKEELRQYRAKLKADSAEGKGCLYGVRCLEDPTNALVGKVKMLHSVCRKHVGKYERDMLKQTECTIRRAQAADDYNGPALLQQMLDAAWEISEFISAPSRAGLADALATDERVVWYDTGASHCAAMSPEEAQSSTQKWTGGFLARVGAVDSQGAVVRAVRRCTDLCKAPGATARAHCKWEVFEGRSDSYALLQQTRTCSEAEMKIYLETFLAGSLCVGYDGGIDESRMRGYLGRYMFADDDEMLSIMGGGPDLDELDTRMLDSDELLDAFRVRLLYRVLQEVWRRGQE